MHKSMYKPTQTHAQIEHEKMSKTEIVVLTYQFSFCFVFTVLHTKIPCSLSPPPFFFSGNAAEILPQNRKENCKGRTGRKKEATGRREIERSGPLLSNQGTHHEYLGWAKGPLGAVLSKGPPGSGIQGWPVDRICDEHAKWARARTKEGTSLV